MLDHKIKIPEGMDAVEFARLARPTIWRENQVLGDEIQRLKVEVKRLHSFLDDAVDSAYQCQWEKPWREVFKEWKAKRQEGEA